MSKSFPMVPLSRCIRYRKEFVQIDDLENYKRCRVQLHGKGIVLRDMVAGSEIKTKEQQVCRAGEFLVAEIDAKVGGFGIVPDGLDGAIVSSHYFLFQVDGTVLDRGFLDFFIRTAAFREQVSAQGSTNYAAIRPKDVLGYQVPLPALGEQRRIVSRIDELVPQVRQAHESRMKAVEETDVLLKAAARRLLVSVDAKVTELSCWLDPNREGIQTGPFGAQLGAIDFTEYGVPVLMIGNVQYGGLRLDSLRFVSERKARQLARYTIKAGDILFARMGTVGRCCIAPQEAEGWLINYHIIRVALDKSRVEPRFIHWTIRVSADVGAYLDEKIRGATRQGVNSAIVKALPCRVPPLGEQRRMVAHLDNLQGKLGAVKRLQADSATELDALLPSILDKAFKGEL